MVTNALKRGLLPRRLMTLAAFLLLASVNSAAPAGFTQIKELALTGGWDADISGDTAIVSDRGHVLAYILQRNQGGPDNWGTVKVLNDAALVPSPNTGFTSGVSIDGDIAVVGSDFENRRTGAAYIYGRNVGGPDNWGLIKRIEDPDGLQVGYPCGCDDFGASVAVSGDTIAVGETWAARVDIFQKDEGGTDNWGRVTVVTASDAGPVTGNNSDRFSNVAMQGDTLVVGAPSHTHAGISSSGGAYVFDRNQGGADHWGQVKELLASDASVNAAFGSAMAIDGDTVVVLAPRLRAVGNSYAEVSAAYVFERNAGGANNWGQAQELVPNDVRASEKCGTHYFSTGSYAVDISGDTVVVSNCEHDHPDPANPAHVLSWGADFVFQRDEGGPENWGQTQELLSVPVSGTFGTPAIEGHTLLATDQYVSRTKIFDAPSDTTPPDITVPGDLSAEATGPDGAAVTYSASATDAIDGSVAVSCAPQSGSTFPLGGTTVTCTASDTHNNTATSSFTVTVVDTTPPALSLPASFTVEAAGPSGASASYSASASDLVSGAVTPSCSPASGLFPIGTTTVNCSATDGAGNTASGSFTITVADRTPPAATASLVRVGHGGDDDESMQFFQVVFSATDAVGVVTLSADLNGIRVTNGQIVQLQTTNHAPSARRDDGRLQIRAASFLLTVTAADAAGNVGSATAVPVFVKNGRDHDDKERGKGDDKGKGGDRGMGGDR